MAQVCRGQRAHPPSPVTLGRCSTSLGVGSPLGSPSQPGGGEEQGDPQGPGGGSSGVGTLVGLPCATPHPLIVLQPPPTPGPPPQTLAGAAPPLFRQQQRPRSSRPAPLEGWVGAPGWCMSGWTRWGSPKPGSSPSAGPALAAPILQMWKQRPVRTDTWREGGAEPLSELPLVDIQLGESSPLQSVQRSVKLLHVQRERATTAPGGVGKLG